MKNILSDLISHRIINLIPTFDDKDLHWISQVKYLINEKNATYKNYLKDNKSNQSLAMFQSLQN